jgi:hypothetical protein
MNLALVRAGLTDVLGSVAGLRVYDTAPETIEPPAATVFLGSATVNDDFDGAYTVSWSIVLLVSRAADDSRAQRALDSTINDVVDAIDADNTLGGVVDSADVAGWDDPGTFTYGETDYIGTAVTVETIG